MVSLEKSFSISQEGDLSELVAAQDGQTTVKSDPLATHVEAGGAARTGEVDRWRHVATTERVDTDGAADGTAESGAISLLAKSFVEVEHLDVVVDLTAPGEAEAALERGGHVDLDAVLVDLDVGVVVDPLGLAEESGAGVEDTLNAEVGLHPLVERSVINDVNNIAVSEVQGRALLYSVQSCLFGHSWYVR